VVQWDQRGAGKTLETTGRSVADTMSVTRMAQDGVEVVDFLRNHLHKDKIILLGHSWGSILGIHIVKQRPDLFYAYVGTGQVSDMQGSQRMSYAHLLEKARAANDTKTEHWSALVRRLLTAGKS
jgi:pimeloyl-ACP methyl ester carboxylesterase